MRCANHHKFPETTNDSSPDLNLYKDPDLDPNLDQVPDQEPMPISNHDPDLDPDLDPYLNSEQEREKYIDPDCVLKLLLYGEFLNIINHKVSDLDQE